MVRRGVLRRFVDVLIATGAASKATIVTLPSVALNVPVALPPTDPTTAIDTPPIVAANVPGIRSAPLALIVKPPNVLANVPEGAAVTLPAADIVTLPIVDAKLPTLLTEPLDAIATLPSVAANVPVAGPPALVARYR